MSLSNASVHLSLLFIVDLYVISTLCSVKANEASDNFFDAYTSVVVNVVVVIVVAIFWTLHRDARRLRLDMVVVNNSSGHLIIAESTTREGGDVV